ncbi:hypothetical protein ACFLRQ_01500 [Bacteroidota bacterium]
MLKTEFIRIFFAYSILLVLSMASLNGQVSEHELPALRKKALEKYDAGEYLLAEADFMRLLRQFPGDPMYRYYTGICKVEANKDLEEAIELLHFASSRGVPVDVSYYLGEAYRKLYDFDKAKKYYIEFDKEASRSHAKERNSKLLIRSAVYAKQITSSYNSFELLNQSYIDLSNKAQYAEIHMKGGDLSYKPEDLFAAKEDRNDLNSLMFLPRDVSSGDQVYFSSLMKNGKDGFQIMLAKKGRSGKWVDINPIDEINTDQNEILPYFDPIGQDIYFASDGHEGLGGFDLYRSHYDEDLDKWSYPVNLGFPINSVLDDYLFLPGRDLGMAMLFSGRQMMESSVALYRIQLREPKQSLLTATPEEIKRVSNIGNHTEEVTAEFDYFEPELDEKIQNEKPVNNQDLEENSASDESENPEYDENFQKLISNALMHQTISDSLTELAIASRSKLKDSSDSDNKWISQKQVMVWEKEAIEEQKKADEYFSAIADFGKDSSEELIKIDTIINDITVFNFVVDDSIREKVQKDIQQSLKKETGDKSMAKANEALLNKEPKNDLYDKNSDHRAYGFEILSKAPYSAENPIQVMKDLPQGAFYRIQLIVYSKFVKPDTFGGLFPLSAETLPERKLVRYYAGNFTQYSDAQKALPRIRSSGYKDAFIVAWYNGKKMSPEKVRKLEK